MKKTLRNRIGLGLLVGMLGFGSGCSSGFYRETSFVWDAMPKIIQPVGHVDYKKQKSQRNIYCEEDGKCYHRKNYIYFKNGEWYTVKGYTWDNPDNPRDLRVKKLNKN